MKLNEKLIKLRKENNLSQEEFGNIINVSRQAVSKWENGETKPDIDKVQEIGKHFNLSFDYLLNDEFENSEPVVKNEVKPKKSKLKLTLKILLVILLIYALICVYKFIVLYRFYLIANSFSEENYSMINSFQSLNKLNNEHFENINGITKIGNIIIEDYYNYYEGNNTTTDAEGNIIPARIDYTDLDKKIAYSLIYDPDLQKYSYTDNSKSNSFFSKNYIKETTFNNIPSNFKNIATMSINPMYFVSAINREIIYHNFIHQFSSRVTLTNDYLVESVQGNSEFNLSFETRFSYDYVPGHFKERTISDPLEKYKDMIIYEEQ